MDNLILNNPSAKIGKALVELIRIQSVTDDDWDNADEALNQAAFALLDSANDIDGIDWVMVRSILITQGIEEPIIGNYLDGYI